MRGRKMRLNENGENVRHRPPRRIEQHLGLTRFVVLGKLLWPFLSVFQEMIAKIRESILPVVPLVSQMVANLHNQRRMFLAELNHAFFEVRAFLEQETEIKTKKNRRLGHEVFVGMPQHTAEVLVE